MTQASHCRQRNILHRFWVSCQRCISQKISWENFDPIPRPENIFSSSLQKSVWMRSNLRRYRRCSTLPIVIFLTSSRISLMEKRSKPDTKESSESFDKKLSIRRPISRLKSFWSMCLATTKSMEVRSSSNPRWQILSDSIVTVLSLPENLPRHHEVLTNSSPHGKWYRRNCLGFKVFILLLLLWWN